MKRVFISYASEDGALALKLYRFLKGKELDIFWDKSSGIAKINIYGLS